MCSSHCAQAEESKSTQSHSHHAREDFVPGSREQRGEDDGREKPNPADRSSTKEISVLTPEQSDGEEEKRQPHEVESLTRAFGSTVEVEEKPPRAS